MDFSRSILILTLTYQTLSKTMDNTPNTIGTQITLEETGANTGEFEIDQVVTLKATAKENANVDIAYAENTARLVVRSGDISISITADDVWSSQEEATVTLTNPDINLNTEVDENIEIDADFIPTITIGNPATILDFTYDDDTIVLGD